MVSARASCVICGVLVTLCTATWLLAEILLRQPDTKTGVILASSALNALFIAQFALLVILSAVVIPVAASVGKGSERLSGLLAPVLIPLPLTALLTVASGVSLSKVIVSLAFLGVTAVLISVITGMRRVTAASDAVVSTVQLTMLAVLFVLLPIMNQWWQI